MKERINVYLKVGPKRRFPIEDYVKKWTELFSEEHYKVFILNDSGIKFDIQNTVVIDNFIKTKEAREIKSRIANTGITERWQNTAIAHLFPFFHSDTEIFWGIDADDLFFHDIKFKNVLGKIEQKFRNENMFSYSYDMYYTENTCHYTDKNFPLNHWSFGINLSKKDGEVINKIIKTQVLKSVDSKVRNIDMLFDLNRKNHNVKSFIIDRCPLHHGYPTSFNYQIHNFQNKKKHILYFLPWFYKTSPTLYRDAEAKDVDIYY